VSLDSTHTGPAPDYFIDAHWLERVDEVVGYARYAGLYSVINLHHDGAFA
jgi:endoglucanase